MHVVKTKQNDNNVNFNLLKEGTNADTMVELFLADHNHQPPDPWFGKNRYTISVKIAGPGIRVPALLSKASFIQHPQSWGNITFSTLVKRNVGSFWHPSKWPKAAVRRPTHRSVPVTKTLLHACMDHLDEKTQHRKKILLGFMGQSKLFHHVRSFLFSD